MRSSEGGRRLRATRDPALHHALGRGVEAELAVEVVRVPRMQDPPELCKRPAFDHLLDKLDTKTSAAILRQDVDVGEVHERDTVGERTGEPELASVVVHADDALRLADQARDDVV